MDDSSYNSLSLPLSLEAMISLSIILLFAVVPLFLCTNDESEDENGDKSKDTACPKKKNPHPHEEKTITTSNGSTQHQAKNIVQFTSHSLGFGEPVVVGISGCTGSGKTYVCDKIVEYINKKFGASMVTVLNHDHYYKGGDTNTNYDVPDAIDFDLFTKHLEMLIQGQTVKSPIYNFKTHNREEDKYIEIPYAPLIIVEGILIFTQEKIRNMCNLKVFVETNDATRIFRRVGRDVSERGRTLEEVEHRYKTHVTDSQIQYILPSARHADLKINNEKDKYTGLNVLLAFLESQMKNVIESAL